MTWWSKFWLTLGILAFISLAVTYATADHLGPIGYAVLALAGVSLIELATSLVYLAKSDMPFRRGYAERLIDFVQSPQVPAKTLTVIRAPGDEAAGGLAAGQFVAWTASILNRILSHIGLAAVVTLGVNVAVLVAAWTSSPWLMTTAMEVFGYLLVAVAAVGIFLLGASFIFGLDGPLVGLFATITVDAAPPGKVEIVQVKPYPVNNDATRLIHSELYSDTNIIEAIVQSIAGGRKG